MTKGTLMKENIQLGLGLQFQTFSPFMSRWGAWQLATGAGAEAAGYTLIHRHRETGRGMGFWTRKTSPVETLLQENPKNSSIWVFIFLFKSPRQQYARRSQERLLLFACLPLCLSFPCCYCCCCCIPSLIGKSTFFCLLIRRPGILSTSSIRLELWNHPVSQTEQVLVSPV